MGVKQRGESFRRIGANNDPVCCLYLRLFLEVRGSHCLPEPDFYFFPCPGNIDHIGIAVTNLAQSLVSLYLVGLYALFPDPPSKCHPCLRRGRFCGVAFDRSSLQRIAHTPQSSLLGALPLTPCWCPGICQNPLPTLLMKKVDSGLWPL